MLMTLSRKPWLRVGLAAGLFTAVVSLFVPNLYVSEVRILPADQRLGGGLGGLSTAAAAVGVSIPGQDSPDAAFVDILSGRSLRENLLNTRFTFPMRTWYLASKEVRDQTLYDYLGVKNMDRAVKALKKQISVSRDYKTKLITIAVESESPQLSQQVAQRLVRLLEEFLLSKSRTRGSAKAEFSEKRLQEARIEMGQAEDAFRSYLEGNRNFTVSADPSVRLRGQRLESELKLRTQLVTTLAIAREQALLEEKNDMPILNLLDAGNLPIEKSWPPRSLAVGLAVILGAAISWGVMNRSRLTQLLASNSQKADQEQA